MLSVHLPWLSACSSTRIWPSPLKQDFWAACAILSIFCFQKKNLFFCTLNLFPLFLFCIFLDVSSPFEYFSNSGPNCTPKLFIYIFSMQALPPRWVKQGTTQWFTSCVGITHYILPLRNSGLKRFFVPRILMLIFSVGPRISQGFSIPKKLNGPTCPHTKKGRNWSTNLVCEFAICTIECWNAETGHTQKTAHTCTKQQNSLFLSKRFVICFVLDLLRVSETLGEDIVLEHRF